MPTTKISSGLDSKLTCSIVPTHDFLPPITIEEWTNLLTYLFTCLLTNLGLSLLPQVRHRKLPLTLVSCSLCFSHKRCNRVKLPSLGFIPFYWMYLKEILTVTRKISTVLGVVKGSGCNITVIYIMATLKTCNYSVLSILLNFTSCSAVCSSTKWT